MLRNFFVICGSVVMGLARFAQGVPGKLVSIRMLQIETSGDKSAPTASSATVSMPESVFLICLPTHILFYDGMRVGSIIGPHRIANVCVHVCRESGCLNPP